MVSGGGKDRKVVLWGHDYRKQAEMEVRDVTCPVSFKDIFFFFFYPVGPWRVSQRKI